jgi:hypothetical protein
MDSLHNRSPEPERPGRLSSASLCGVLGGAGGEMAVPRALTDRGLLLDFHHCVSAAVGMGHPGKPPMRT